MKTLFIGVIAVLFGSTSSQAQDAQHDKSRISDASLSLSHLVNLFTLHGAPKNQTDDSVVILINHGYCIGFSKKYNQPLWAAYQVSKPGKDLDYERFPLFVDDSRLPAANRITSATFGGGYDRGHMVPNEAINRQYGKMAQMETFLMSNISPQRKELNQGVWMRLEKAIRENYINNRKDSTHLWVLTGPVFGANPNWIERPGGVKVAVPDSFFCILARPARYPQDNPTSAQYLAFLFPQEIAQNETVKKRYLVSIDQIEQLTGLNFFPAFTPSNQQRLEKDAALAVW